MPVVAGLTVPTHAGFLQVVEKTLVGVHGFWGFLGCAILSKENAVVRSTLALWMQYALYDASSKRLFSAISFI